MSGTGTGASSHLSFVLAGSCVINRIITESTITMWLFNRQLDELIWLLTSWAFEQHTILYCKMVRAKNGKRPGTNAKAFRVGHISPQKQEQQCEKASSHHAEEPGMSVPSLPAAVLLHSGEAGGSSETPWSPFLITASRDGRKKAAQFCLEFESLWLSVLGIFLPWL